MEKDRKFIKRANEARQLSLKVSKDRIVIYLATLICFVGVCLQIYTSFTRDNLDIVLWDGQYIDSPKKLNKIKTSKDAILNERYIWGFVRRFIQYRFIRPSDSTNHAKRALRWMEAHVHDSGRARYIALMEDFERYDNLRRNTYNQFTVLNEQDKAFKLRQSKKDGSVFYVDLRGTFETFTKEGAAAYDVTLKLKIRRVFITSKSYTLGARNYSGLIVEGGYIDYIDDYVSGEVRRWNLFYGEIDENF